MPTEEEAYVILQRSFEENPYPKPADYKLLVAVTGLKLNDIKKWFASTRGNLRKKGDPGSWLEYRFYRQLETEYDVKKNPSRQEMKAMAERMNLNLDQVTGFFAKKWHRQLQADDTLENITDIVGEPDSIVYI